MEEIGVKAVVAGLSSFLGDMGKVDSSIASIIPTSKLLGSAFDWLGGIVSGFVGGAARTLQYALGNLISSAIQGVIGWLKELGQEVIASTTEFQKMEVRLNRMNFNDLTEDEKKLGNAMDVVTAQTKEQLSWINKLAASTPFDAEDIATTYTLARTYGFTNQEAQALTYQISEFAAGMGLSNQHIERIIQNFGQMKAAGKITGTEIRDLARGAFVPVNEILEKVADNLGITTDQLAKLRQSGMTDAEMFFTAFSGMVEDNFIGAAEDMNTILMVATQNIKDMFKSMLSLEVFKGLFEALAVKASGFQQAMFARWDEVEALFTEIGGTLKDILTDIVGLTPSAESMADGVVGALENISAWLFENKDEIANWAESFVGWVSGTVVPAIVDLKDWLFGKGDNEGAIQKFGKWLGETFVPIVQSASNWVGNVLIPFLRDDLKPVFIALGPLVKALGKVLSTAFGGKVDKGFSNWIRDTLIPGIQDLTKWILENKDQIALWLERWLKGALILMGIAVIIGGLVGLIGEIASAIVGWIAEGDNLKGILIVLGLVVLGLIAIFFGVPLAIIALVAAIVMLIGWIWNSRDAISAWATETWDTFVNWANNIETVVNEWVASVFTSIGQWAIDTLTSFGQWAIDTWNAIVNWSSNSQASISDFTTGALGTFIAFGINILANILTTFSNLFILMDSKMGEIARMLLQKAGGWITQIINGFSNRASEIIDALNDLIDDIQASLHDIIISVFYDTSGAPSGGGGSGGGGGGGGGSGNGGGGGGSGGYNPCFIAGTMVFMGNGSLKKVEDIEVGDHVTSYDTDREIILPAEVTEVFHHEPNSGMYYFVINGHLGVTPNHLMFANGSWIPASDVVIGDYLKGIGGDPIRVNSISRVDSEVPTYNLHTGHETHNYFANGVLVHNVKAEFSGGGGSGGGKMASVSAGSSVNTNTQVRNEFNLSIISSAPTEAIIADFGMMQSLGGS